MAEENQTTHKRRVRYSGKYPKKVEEKYKELQPEKYKDTIEHVIKQALMRPWDMAVIRKPCCSA